MDLNIDKKIQIIHCNKKSEFVEQFGKWIKWALWFTLSEETVPSTVTDNWCINTLIHILVETTILSNDFPNYHTQRYQYLCTNYINYLRRKLSERTIVHTSGPHYLYYLCHIEE